MGLEHGLPENVVITCDKTLTLDSDPTRSRTIGVLGHDKRAELDRALHFALDIAF